MATLNRRAVTTSVAKELSVNIVDVNKVIAIISDVTTIGVNKKLYTSFDDVAADWLPADEFYLMAETFFLEGGTQLYAVPLANTLGNADIVGKLTNLANDPDPTFSFIVVITDKVIGVATQVSDLSLITYAFDKEFNILLDSSEAAILTAATTDIASLNKAYYDALVGDNKLKIGNMSFAYTDVVTDYPMSGVAGRLMSKNIGEQTVKFMAPQKSGPIVVSDSELTNVLNKQVLIYTATNERPGFAFMKEGITLKDGDYIDTSLGGIWIKVQLETAVYNLFLTKKVPINVDGFADLENITSPVFEQAIDQGIIDGNNDTPYTIAFSADPVITRGFLGTYTYFDAVAGHFVTNTVTIKQGS